MTILKAGRPTNKQKAIELVREDKEVLEMVCFKMSKSLHKQLKQRALDEDTSATDIIIKTVKEYLNK